MIFCFLESYGVDGKKLEKYLLKNTKVVSGSCYNKNTNRKIKAIIIVHLFGHPAKIDPIVKIAKKFKLKIIEDAAESIGSYYKKKHTGTIGHVGVISFNGNKSLIFDIFFLNDVDVAWNSFFLML